MDKFEHKEMKKIGLPKNSWYDLLINCIPDPIRKSVGGLKNKIVSLFKTNKPKQTLYGRGRKLSRPKTQNIGNTFVSRKGQR